MLTNNSNFNRGGCCQLPTAETETETLANHPVLGPTDSATEDRAPLTEGEKENRLGCMTMHSRREGLPYVLPAVE
jgi:hypothetical protein